MAWGISLTTRIDAQALEARIRAGRAGARRADARAQYDAARQVRTRAKRSIAQKLNLRVKEIADTLRVTTSSGAREFRAGYRPIPAHKALRWRYSLESGSSAITEHTGRRLTFRRRARTSSARRGLIVRFSKGAPALVFTRAFRTRRVGGGRPFIERKGRGRYPTRGIRARPPHSEALVELSEYADFGREAYLRRLRYWRERYDAL